MADKYQKDSKAASFKKHKEIPAGSAELSMFLVVAEPGEGVLAGAGVGTGSPGFQGPSLALPQRLRAAKCPRGSEAVGLKGWGVTPTQEERDRSHHRSAACLLTLEGNLVQVEFFGSVSSLRSLFCTWGDSEPHLTSCGFKVSAADERDQTYCSLKSDFLLLMAKYSLINKTRVCINVNCTADVGRL